MSTTLDYKDWTVDKERVALYAFADKSKHTVVDDIFCRDGVDLLITELDRIKQNLSNSVDKTDPTLNLALHYFVVCTMSKTGLVATSSGSITSESMEGMSVSYGGQNIKTGVKSPYPIDYCSMALDMVNRFAAKSGLIARNIKVAVKNYRSYLLRDIYNKNTGKYKHGVP